MCVYVCVFYNKLVCVEACVLVCVNLCVYISVWSFAIWQSIWFIAVILTWFKKYFY